MESTDIELEKITFFLGNMAKYHHRNGNTLSPIYPVNSVHNDGFVTWFCMNPKLNGFFILQIYK